MVMQKFCAFTTVYYIKFPEPIQTKKKFLANAEVKLSTLIHSKRSVSIGIVSALF